MRRSVSITAFLCCWVQPAFGQAMPAPSAEQAMAIDADEHEPSIELDDVDWGEEGGSYEFGVRLSRSSSRSVTVDFETAPGGGVGAAGPAETNDYTHVEGTLTFDPGDIVRTITVAITDDSVHEGPEHVNIVLSNAQGAALDSDTGHFFIGDNDPVPGVSISDAVGPEASGELVFPVTLSGPVEGRVSMEYSTEDGSAAAGVDYTAATNETLTFDPLQTANSIRIALLDDDDEEQASKTFTVRLRQTPGPLAGVARREATGTILDDDGATTLSIADGSAFEAADTVSVTVTLGGQAGEPVTLDYATEDITATAGSDYVATSGPLSFAPGETRRTIAVSLMDDGIREPDETFAIRLSNVNGATLIADGRATVTIRDDDSPPEMTVHGSESPEGGHLEFVVSLSEPSAGTVSANYLTDVSFEQEEPPALRLADGGSDFDFKEGTLTFPPGEITKTIRVRTLVDAVTEPDEAVVLTLTNPVGATFERRSETAVCPWSACDLTACCDCGLIQDVATEGVALNVSDAVASEGDGSLAFEVTMVGTPNGVVTADYETVADSASADTDYSSTSGTLNFDAGSRSRTVRVDIVDDSLPEDDETLLLRLLNAPEVTLGPPGRGTIRDDDSPNRLSIGHASGLEDAGELSFTVTLSDPAATPVTVAYSTSDGSATAGSDYIVTTGVLTFEPDATAATVYVSIVDDDVEESVETFSVLLAEAVGAPIGTGGAVGTIFDDDGDGGATVALSIAGATATEGDGVLEFPVTLSVSAATSVTVSYATSEGSANASADYRAVEGTLTFTPGETEAAIRVDVLDDRIDEPDETFTIRLTGPVGAVLVAGEAVGTILDDDAPPALSIADADGPEDIGELDFVVTLDGSSAQPVTVAYASRDATAMAASDYRSASGMLTFPAGETTGTIRVAVLDDGVDEVDETFEVVLEGAVGGTLADAFAVGTIRDDDAMPVLSVDDATGSENAAELSFRVTLDTESSRRVTAGFATSDQTALSGIDYQGVTGTLTFEPGETLKQVSVPVLPDALDEADETFALVLSNPVHARVSTEPATGTILDDDEMPGLSVVGASGPETVGELTFAIDLDAPSGRRVSVDYATADRTARAGEDYEGASGTLVFEPSVRSATVRIVVLDDRLDEADETFAVVLSHPSHAVLLEHTAIGTITDDDEPPTVVEALPEVRLCVGGAPRELDLAAHFAGMGLRYRAESAHPAVAEAFQQGGMLRVSPVLEGETSVTVTVTNEVGAVAVTFGVTVVTDPAELAAVDRALGLMGSHLLGSVTAAVRGRFDDGQTSPRAGAQGVRPGGMLPSFTLAAGAPARERSWSVWGHGSGRRFSRGPDDRFDGSLSGFHLGVNIRRADWRAGVAVAVSESETDYRYERSAAACGGGGMGDGQVGMELVTVQPYAGRYLDRGGSLWVVVGTGQGEATIERCASMRGVADLRVGLAAAGGRHPILQRERWRLSLLEDIGTFSVDTDDRPGPLGGRSVTGSRARLGVEASWWAGESLRTFVRAMARGDWIAGDVHAGLEVGTGARYRSPASRLGLDVGAWMLPASSRSDRREFGADVALSLLPRPDGTGVRVSLRSRTGSGGRPPSNWLGMGERLGDDLQTATRGWSLEGTVGHGIAATRIGGTVIPFFEFDTLSRSAATGLRFQTARTAPFRLGIDIDHDIRFGYRMSVRLGSGPRSDRHLWYKAARRGTGLVAE